MKLNKFNIKNFKCILDTGTVVLNDGVGCMIGNNDGGKTTVLEALHRFNPLLTAEASVYDLEDFPKDKIVYRSPNAVIFEGFFQLSKDEIDIINQKFGIGSLPINEIKVTKNYANKLQWQFETSDVCYIRHLMNKKGFDETYINLISSAKKLSECIEKLSSVVDKPKNLVSFINQLEILELRPLQDEIIEGYFLKWLPKFYYLKAMNAIKNNISLKQVNKSIYAKEKPDSIDPTLYVAKMLDIDIDEIIFSESNDKIKERLDELSEKINQKIHELFPLFKHCKIKLSANKVNEASEEFIDAILSISIENNINNIVIKLEKGSSAIINIITFLSLITGLLSLAGNLVLLMDTQTLGLDCNNQRQFCNYIYNYLSKDIQVLFTTNSPLMINLGRKESLYVVKYNKNLGSTADQKLDTADNNPSLSCYRYALKLVE